MPRLLNWVHQIGPGFLVLLAGLALGVAFILQVLVSVGLPNIRGLYFLTFSLEDLGQEVRIGLWTICTRQFLSSFFVDDGETCQNASLGYEDSQYAPVARMLLMPGLSKALVMQPIATGLSGLAVAATGLHLCSNAIVWPFLCALAAVGSILAFVFEIALFSVARSRLSRYASDFGSPITKSAFGAGIWLQLAALVIVCFATFLDWTAFTRRKLGRTHAGRFGKKAPSIYRASVAGSRSSGTATKSGLYDAATATPGSRTDSRKGFHNDGQEESYELKNKAAPLATAEDVPPHAGTAPLKTYHRQRKSVPSYDDVDERSRRSSHGNEALSPSGIVGEDGELVSESKGRGRRGTAGRRTSESDNDEGLFEDAVDDGAAPASPSLESVRQYNEPMDPTDETVISPQRGTRAARYSARMAELGLE
ncbi:unnamed protein product [Parajaminaea phylloscopi]